jgi:small-conductance mechanosensitive channel
VQQAQLEKIEQHIALLDLQRDVNERRLELAHERTAYRELGRDIVKTMLHRKKPEEKKIKEWLQTSLSTFRSKASSTDLMISKLADEQKSQRYRLSENETKVASFEKRMSDRTLGKVHHLYADIILLLKQQARFRQNLLSMSSDQLTLQETMRDDVTFVLSRLERDQRSLNIWQRSDLALTTENLRDAWNGAKRVFGFLWDRTLTALNPFNLLRSLRTVSLYELALFFLFVLGLLFFMIFFRFGLIFMGQRIDRLLYIYQGQTFAIYLTFGRSLIRFFETHCRGLSLWLYLRLFVVLVEPQLWSSEWWAYTISMFFLLTIPFFLYISRTFMVEFKKINQRMSFLFFTERLEDKFLFLMSSTLYTSAVLLPLRRVFLTYPYSNEVQLSNVLRGGWTLILTLIVLFFFSKDDVFRFLPSQSPFAQWFRGKVDQYYYPVFIFAIGLSILVNPYVGYTNFAVYLAICIPLTVVISYALFTLQGYVRRYSVYMFMKDESEEEEEVTDRFEHAKLYYGFFVVFTFIGSCLAAFMAITRIWGFEYTVAQLWQGLSHDWVVSFEGTGVHIGLGGALTLSVFIVGGLIASSLFNKFVLTRLFDIFRTEYGAQNTASRVLHYLIVILSLVLGLHAIKLGQLGNWVLLALAAGIAFGSRDLVADFFAGIWILFERPIELGNFIETGSLKGTVKSIAMRATTIRTAKNFSVVIPNRELVAKPIINWGAGYYAVGFEFTLLVGYNANADEVRDLIAQVVSDNKLVLRIPAVTVRLDEFEDSGYRFFVRAFISSRRVRDQWDVASQIRLVLTKEFDARGIKIPYPHRKIIHSMKSFEVTKQQIEEMSEK